jgi:hypothetical protein
MGAKWFIIGYLPIEEANNTMLYYNFVEYNFS